MKYEKYVEIPRHRKAIRRLSWITDQELHEQVAITISYCLQPTSHSCHENLHGAPKSAHVDSCAVK